MNRFVKISASLRKQTAKTLQNGLKQAHETAITVSTVRRRLRESVLIACSLAKGPLLTAQRRTQRGAP